MRVEITKVKADELEQYQNVSCWTPVLLFPGTVEFVCLKKKTLRCVIPVVCVTRWEG